MSDAELRALAEQWVGRKGDQAGKSTLATLAAGVIDLLDRLPATPAARGEEAVEPALWNLWTAGEKLAYGVGFRRGRAESGGLDVDVLTDALSGIGVIDNGTWVSFTRADAERIAGLYALHFRLADSTPETT